MLGLWEKVKWLDFIQAVTRSCEQHQITHLRGGIAGNVNDPLGSKREQLLQELLATACARRIDDDHRVTARMRHLGKDLTSIRGDESAIR
jgi:hypothetical protein